MTADAPKVRDAVESCVNADGEQWMALLHSIERVTPLLDGCVTGDLGCECTVDRKVLVEETVKLFKGAERTEKIVAVHKF